MELHELHVLQGGASVVRERVSVAGVFPAIARHAVRSADAAGCENHGLRREDLEASALAVVTQRAGNPIPILEQRDDRAFHVHVYRLIDRVVLQCADHLETGAVSHVRQSRVFVSAEIALENPSIGSAVEHCAPCLELAHAIRRFLRVKLGHPPVIEILAAAHRVGEVHSPVVSIVDVAERRRDTAFGHHGVRFTEERFADETD